MGELLPFRQVAVCLYENQSYASAAVLAVYAWEELGRSRILLKLRLDVLDGTSVDVEQIGAACEDHVTKLRAHCSLSHAPAIGCHPESIHISGRTAIEGLTSQA
jgi:AbiV family abortive infection protein